MKQTTQQKLDEINRDLFQASLIDKLDTLNKIMNTFLVLAFDGSTFKSKTNDEIKKVMPKINETLKTINKQPIIKDNSIIY